MNNLIGGQFGYDWNNQEKSSRLGSLISSNLFYSGRMAFFSILKKLKKYGVNEIEIPLYLCGSILQTIKKSQMKYSFYTIDKNFNPKPKLYSPTLDDILDRVSIILNSYGLLYSEYPNKLRFIDSTG